ncbi:sensor histidine kinase [Larkinella bovis]|uniref:histidine kinase n=1 Tax=Larkinella bovis TaxID=683041 RepID=A0ABW0IB52_9BACT
MKFIAPSIWITGSRLLGWYMKWVLLACCTGFWIACEPAPVNDVNRAAVIGVSKGVNAAHRFLDSAYDGIPDAGRMDRYRNYLFLTRPYGQAGIEQRDDVKSLVDEDRLFALFNRDWVKGASNRVSLLVVVAFLSIVVISALLSWLGWKRTRRNLAESTALNRVISEQNRNLQATLADLEKSQQENDRLLKVVAHDLRTPLSSVSMAVGLLLEGKPLSRDPRFFLEMIRDSSASALDLIDNLLHSKTVLDKKRAVDLSEFLASGVEMLQLKARDKKQSIELQTVPVQVMMDRQKMGRVMSNLITNAIKFSPSGSTTYVQAEKRGEVVLITVKDQGIGIPATLQDNVFDLFTAAKRPGTAGEKTFGLGLAISRQIVEAHGGKLWFETEENRGTTFFVELSIS